MRTPMMRLLPRLVWLMLCLCIPVGTAAAGAIDSEALALSLPALPESARITDVVEDDGPQLEARLLVSNDPTRRIGVLFDLAPGWHLYWRNPGETGFAPNLELEVDRHRVGDLAWPAPRTFREADGLFTTYGYEKRVLLVAPIEAIEEGDASDVVARAHASVLVCRTQCVPASFTLSTPLDPDLPERQQSVIDGLFRAADTQIPISAEALGLEADAHWIHGTPEPDETGRLELSLRSCSQGGQACRSGAVDSAGSLFIPMEGDTFEFSSANLVREDEIADEAAGTWTIALEATRLEAGEDRLRGLVMVQDSSGRTRHVELDIPIGLATSQAAVSQTSSSKAALPAPISPGRWIQIFLLALLGGLILNGMPCVLPVLAIKVVAIADMAEKDPRDVQLHGLAYTGGVLGSMLLLSAIVIGLRTAGHSVGWGFQFQEPIFVAAISALLVAFALNLFGVFEIEFGQGRLAGIGHNSAGFQRSAFEGLLAVILATPCTAPFLGTAVGFAFATSGLGIVSIFLAIGLGLASPFLLVSFFPRLARFSPRSGPWMMKLRAGLGFSLLATVVWLLWVLGQAGGANAVIAMTGNLLFLSFLLWGFGQIQPVRNVWLARASAITIVSLAFAGFDLIDFDQKDDRSNDRSGTHAEDARAPQTESGWRTYSAQAVDDALAAGQPSFVVFTADWCITCKVNEHTVLDRLIVQQALRENGFVLFKADWTRRDETIRKKLAEFGRAGVPLYLVYSPDAPNHPQVLSELLSRREVITALTAHGIADRG
jgi:thiol:disulfide interchange protein/DsbC/DsbD-like thiol-disulfide interchange protein